MNVTANFRNTDSVTVSVTITMELREWKKLRDALTADQAGWKYPQSKLSEAINDVVRKLEMRVEADEPGPVNILPRIPV